MDNISKRSRRWKGRKWLVMMMSMIVMCLAPAYGACSDCEDPNPDYDPDNPYESDPECIPKQNDCTGYVDWYSFGRAKECGICFARGEERRLGSCSLPDCPGCDDRQRLLEGWWQNQGCKGIPWGEVWDRMSGTLNVPALAGLCSTATMSRSTSFSARRITSQWPMVTGSKEPG